MNNLSISDLSEILIDGLKDGAAAISVINALLETANSVRDEMALRKLVGFLSEVEELSAAQRSSVIHEIISNMNEERVGELLLTYIERSESSQMARFIGRAFYALGVGQINEEEFWATAHGFSVIPSFALRTMRRSERGLIDADYTGLFGAAGIAGFLNVGGTAGAMFSFTGRISYIVYSIINDEQIVNNRKALPQTF